MGPFLYVIYVSPLFDLTEFQAFADDNQVLDSDKNLVALINNMERRQEMMAKWLKDSGLMANEEKTEACLKFTDKQINTYQQQN